MSKLYVAFVWHMHQPYYKDPDTGIYFMPWVRLHGTKDYYDMVALLEDFPAVRQTFNLVPCLVEQIREYASGAMDRGMLLTKKAPADLTEDEKVEMLRTFFTGNWERLIHPYRRFKELLALRGRDGREESLRRAATHFSDRDWLDLQVWTNLVWIAPSFRSNPQVRRLFGKAVDFDEEDKEEVLEIHRRILERTVPKYRELWHTGQIEITTTPFYHPILPLLCDTNVAKASLPTTDLPERRFQAPEDARWQIEKGLEYFEETLGRRPRGMWPSEGSVSSQAVQLMADAGVEWIATDEEVLAKSCGEAIKRDREGYVQSPELLYRPYRFELGRDSGGLHMIFRDHDLSDRIGFVYANWPSRKAAEDMVGHLQGIRRDLARRGMEHGLVSIILDGENCWESYENNGRDFLRALYDTLTAQDEIEAVTVGEYLERFPPDRILPKLHPGSWINANFRIWIGHPEDNRAWDLLHRTREMLVRETERHQTVSKHFTAEHAEHAENTENRILGGPFGLAQGKLGGELSERLEAAWREIYIAEGSDWCWWYGDEHSSQDDERFDYLFRRHLARVYEVLGVEVPMDLLQPIRSIGHPSMSIFAPLGLISPDIDGVWSHFYEWSEAGYIDPLKAGGAMHQTSGIVRGIYYGSDLEDLYLRIDVHPSMRAAFEQATVVLDVLEPVRRRVEAASTGSSVRIYPCGDGWESASEDGNISASFRDCFELSVPFQRLDVVAGQELRFRILLKTTDREWEAWPRGGVVSLPVPTEDFVEEPW